MPEITTAQNPTLQTLLAIFPRLHHEDDEQYHRRIDEIQSQMQPFVAPSDQTLFFTRFYQGIQVHMVNQGCPSETSEIVKAQGEKSDIQRMIRSLTVQETFPPNQVNFTGIVFQKLYKNRKSLEVVNNVLYRQFLTST